MKILIVDNYDSFTYNLVHYFEGFDCEVTVWRNDAINFDLLTSFDKLVLSPGPGLPAEANDLMKVIQLTVGKIPILGVCLGFQALVEHFGGSIYNQQLVKHGKSEPGTCNPNSRLFQAIPTHFKLGLYHSWAASKADFPAELVINCNSDNKVIMGFEHSTLPIAGVQFHPESILTENGHQIIQNFLTNFN